MIPFFELKRQYALIKNAIHEELNGIFERGVYILGDENKKFEQEFADYCGVGYAIGCNSGTDALKLAMLSLNIGAGDEVITVSHTAVPTVSSIYEVGATPVFVDIEKDGFLMDVNKIEKAITAKTKAIIPVSLYGEACDIQKINEIAAKYNLSVIEDACQAHGAISAGVKIGARALLTAFSFYPTKNLGAYGDAGMVTTNNKELAGKLVNLRFYGVANKEKYEHTLRGINSRLDEVQAAILRIKLKFLDSWNKRRREIADFYFKNIKNSNIVLPKTREAGGHVFHLFVIRFVDRDRLKKYLLDNGVIALVHYLLPAHKQPVFAGLQREALPETEKISKEILSLPVFPELKQEELEKIVFLLNNFK
ncbi:MAG: DegT/DnrJ/EryC1/StrS family aminotransferase [Candidatus Falkowbacteria bacterium]